MFIGIDHGTSAMRFSGGPGHRFKVQREDAVGFEVHDLEAICPLEDIEGIALSYSMGDNFSEITPVRTLSNRGLVSRDGAGKHIGRGDEGLRPGGRERDPCRGGPGPPPRVSDRPPVQRLFAPGEPRESRHRVPGGTGPRPGRRRLGHQLEHGHPAREGREARRCHRCLHLRPGDRTRRPGRGRHPEGRPGGDHGEPGLPVGGREPHPPPGGEAACTGALRSDGMRCAPCPRPGRTVALAGGMAPAVGEAVESLLERDIALYDEWCAADGLSLIAEEVFSRGARTILGLSVSL